MGTISSDLYDWTEENVKNAPQQPGVYGLLGSERNLIYIGSASNIRERFVHYWTTNFSEDPCKRATRFYRREVRTDYQSRERQLLEQYRREHGRLPKCNEIIP